VAKFVLYLSVLFNIRLLMSPPTLPRTERVVLDLLLDGPDFGLNLVARSDGGLKRGTVYVTLARMEKKGFVTSEQEPQPSGAIGLPRRIYRVTPLGKRALRAWATLVRALASEHGT
jgi:PadR family transcriptional regulator, regulatory protein PadR